MPDDPDNDGLYAEVLKQLLGGVDEEAQQPRDDYFGLVADIVEDYRSFKPSTRGIELSSLQKIVAAVCPNGQPALFLGKSELSWHQGPVSFCRPEGPEQGPPPSPWHWQTLPLATPRQQQSWATVTLKVHTALLLSRSDFQMAL